MRRLSLERRGVAGFFEEIPAAAVAIVALLLFFSALSDGLGNLATREQSNDFSDQAETFLEALLGYQNLTYQNQWGVFDNASMQALTINDITYAFHPEFQYNITIFDISAYAPYPHGKFPQKWLSTGASPTSTSGLSQGWVRDSTTVDVYVQPYYVYSFHDATLTVVIWQ